MKRKISILFALVLALSLSLVTAVPVGAQALSEDEDVTIELEETNYSQSIEVTLGLLSNFYISEIHEWVYNNTFESPMSDFYLDKELKEGIEWSALSWYSQMTTDMTYCQAFGDPVYPAGLTGDVEARFHWTSHFDDPSGDFSFDIVLVGKDGDPYARVFNVAYDCTTRDWSVTTRPYEGSGLEPLTLLPQIKVAIDIKPGSELNSINPNSKGVISVAILTTPDFDATMVDWTTVTFEGAIPAHDLSNPAVLAEHQYDVDEDGDIDMILHFKTQETGISPGDPDATLTGKAYGRDITGTDSVRTVGK